MIALETPRLRLRDYCPGDLESHHALMSDPRVMYYLPDIACHSPEESRQNLNAALAEAQKPTHERRLWFFRMETLAGDPVGSIGYTVTDRTPGGDTAEVGYFIHHAHWGRGYTTEALQAVLAFAFEAHGLHRITCGCLAENRASEAVMVKTGMILEARSKACAWHDGRFKDRVEYRLLREEWLARPSQDKAID